MNAFIRSIPLDFTVLFVLVSISILTHADNRYNMAQKAGYLKMYEAAEACDCEVKIISGSEEMYEDNDYIKYSFIYEVDYEVGDPVRYKFKYKYSKVEKWQSSTVIDMSKKKQMNLDAINSKETK